MRLPYLGFNSSTMKRLCGSEVVTSVFGGLNQKVVAGDGEFANMSNMSAREYPAICTRKKRGYTIKTLLNPNGMHYMEGVFSCYGTNVEYRKSTDIGDEIRLTNVLTNTKHQIVDIGKSFIVFPEKMKFAVTSVTLSNRGYITANYQGSGVTIERADDGIWIRNPYGDVNPSETPFEKFVLGDTVKVTVLDEFGGNYSINGTYTITDVTKITFLETEYVSSIKINCTTWTYEGTSFVPYSIDVSRHVPEFDYILVANNRVWGCLSDISWWPYHPDIAIDGDQIMCCKLGDPTNWFYYGGTAMDSYAATIGNGGDFTGAINFNGNPLFMKKDKIITVYGDKPSNFSVTTKDFPGAKYNDSMVVINQVLYYVGDEGVYAYNGVSPVKISENITEKITDAVGTSFDGKYYLSCKLNNVSKVLVYDVEKGIWIVDGAEEFSCACSGEGKTYIISNSELKEIEGNATETINWMLESVDQRESSIDMKYIGKLKFNLWLDTGSSVTAYIKYDDDASWTTAGTVTATKNTTYTIPVIPRRCNKYRWKITGTGPAKLLAVGRTVMGGSERDSGETY